MSDRLPGMLGLSSSRVSVRLGAITSADQLVGYEITDVLGLVEGVAEGSFPAVAVSGIGISKGGGLDLLVSEAKDKLAKAAGEMGANAVVAVRYESMGRNLEKSVIAYGTAVKCHKL